MPVPPLCRAASLTVWGLRLSLALVAVGLALAALTACTIVTTVRGEPSPSEALTTAEVASVEYRLSQSTPRFDDSTFEFADLDRIEALVDLANAAGYPGGYEPGDPAEPCPPGSGSVYVAATTASGQVIEWSSPGCGRDEAFGAQLWQLARGWHADDTA